MQRSVLGLLLCSTALATACSLAMPSEEDVFGGAGGAAGAASGGSAGTGGGSAGTGSGTSSAGSGKGGAASFGGSSGTSAGTGGRGGQDAGSAGQGGAAGRVAIGAAGEESAGGEVGADAGGESGRSGAGSLVAHFPFDEDGGTRVANVVDPSKPATCAGTCTWPAGRYGRAVGIRNQSENSDWIELPPGLLSGLSEVSISIWVRVLSTGRRGARLFHFSGGADEELFFAPDDEDREASRFGSRLYGRYRGAEFAELWTTSPILTDKEWHHVVVTWDAASIELYIDGARRAEASRPALLPGELGATGPDYLGRSRDEGVLALYAELDDLRVYARALGAIEVAALYLGF